MKQIGVFGVEDTGVPATVTGSSNYTTVVLIHGFTVTSAIFHPLLLFASKYNSRIILLNRRDYPGAVPLSPRDLKPLQDPSAEKLEGYMKLRGQEVYQFLVKLVKQENIPHGGGIVVAGWSLGSGWALALLANISSYKAAAGDESADIEKYVKRVVLLDAPYMALGFPPHPEGWNPLLDPNLDPAEAVDKIFPTWLTSYFTHGPTPSELSFRDPATDAPSTLTNMTPEQLRAIFYTAPGGKGGSDTLVTGKGIEFGLWASLRERAFKKIPGAWENVELRSLWCDRSVWEMIWGTLCFQEDLKKKKDSGGAKLRTVTFVRFKGANHFPQWDFSEETLKALLDDSLEDHSV